MFDRLFTALQYIAPQRGLTWLAGKLSNSETPVLRTLFISFFVRLYRVNLEEAERKSISQYVSFNDFFTRSLAAKARPLAGDREAILSPADGTVSQIGRIDGKRLLQAKGLDYSLTELLAGDTSLARNLEGGLFSTIYLSPRDYHRVHMPVAAKLIRTIYVPGKLFSVSSSTTKHIPNLFSRNERLICEFESESGRFVMILVGAMIVAGIETVWGTDSLRPSEVTTEDLEVQNITLEIGAEMGLFRLGSTVILLMPSNSAHWNRDITAGSTVKVGEVLGTTIESTV